MFTNITIVTITAVNMYEKCMIVFNMKCRMNFMNLGVSPPVGKEIEVTLFEAKYRVQSGKSDLVESFGQGELDILE